MALNKPLDWRRVNLEKYLAAVFYVIDNKP